MPFHKPAIAETSADTSRQTRLDLVVLFTTPELTMAALRGAQRMGGELQADVRLVRVAVIPYPLDLLHPPVPFDFLEQQWRRMATGEAVQFDIRGARDFLTGLRSALRPRSIVILATRRRPWRTRTESLGLRLRQAGYTVVVVPVDVPRGATCQMSFTAF